MRQRRATLLSLHICALCDKRQVKPASKCTISPHSFLALEKFPRAIDKDNNNTHKHRDKQRITNRLDGTLL